MSLPLNGLPTWAKNVALGVAIMVGTFGLFVTRFEYEGIASRLDSQAEIINQILWRVGGPIPTAKQEAATEAAAVTRAWQEALRVAKVGSAPPMPDVVIDFLPRYIIGDVQSRVCGQSFGYYVPDNKGGMRWQVRVEAYVHEGETDTLHTTLVHEFLHYLLGIEQAHLAPEEWVYTLWPYECPAR